MPTLSTSAAVASGGGSPILVVEDEPDVGESIRDVIETSLDVPVALANSASEALEILRRSPVRLIVTDYRMPFLDGLALLGEADKLRPGLPRILVTAYDRDLLGALQGRRERILEKPVDAERLLREIRRAMAMEGSR